MRAGIRSTQGRARRCGEHDAGTRDVGGEQGRRHARAGARRRDAQFDGTATMVSDIFTDTPNTSPYRARAVDKRLFDPDVAFKPFDRRFNGKALAESPVMDGPDDMRAGFREQEREDRERERDEREREQRDR